MESKNKINPYIFLEKNLNIYLNSLPDVDEGNYNGLIVAHGDKCEQYINCFPDIPEEHIRLLHLQTYVLPYCNEVRNTENGFITPLLWINNNYQRFKQYMPKDK